MYRVRAPQGLRTRLGQPDMADLSGLHKLFQRPDRIFDRHLRIDPVLVVQVDVVDAQAPKGTLDRAAHVFRAPVERAAVRVAVAVEPVTELGRDGQGVPPPLDGLAEQNLAELRPVDVGGVEQRDTEVDRGIDDVLGLLLVIRACSRTKAHEAQSDCRNLGAVDPQPAGWCCCHR